MLIIIDLPEAVISVSLKKYLTLSTVYSLSKLTNIATKIEVFTLILRLR